MNLKIFINKHQDGYHKDARVADLDPRQRRQALSRALCEWGEAWPVKNKHGFVYLKQGNQFAELPLDYYSARYEQLYGVFANTNTTGIVIPGIIQPVLSFSLYSYLYTFGNQLGVTRFPPGYETSYKRAIVPVHYTDNNRIAIDLGILPSSTGSIPIKYDAQHTIADEGKQILVNELPTDNDTLVLQDSIGTTTYTFKTSPSASTHILIGDDIYDMSNLIADQLTADGKADAISDINKVLIRPAVLGDRLTVTVDGTKLTSSRLQGVNTLPTRDWDDVLNLLLVNVYRIRASMVMPVGTSANSQQVEASRRFSELADGLYKAVEPNLRVGR